MDCSCRFFIRHSGKLLCTYAHMGEAISVARDTESKARIYGFQAQMKKFSFLFGVYLAELVLMHTDNLSKALQCDTVSAAEAQDTAAMVVRTLQTLRNEEAFDLFWEKVINSAEAFKVEQPELPRKGRIPSRFDDGIGEHEYHSESKTYHRQEYYEALDLSVGVSKIGSTSLGTLYIVTYRTCC